MEFCVGNIKAGTLLSVNYDVNILFAGICKGKLSAFVTKVTNLIFSAELIKADEF